MLVVEPRREKIHNPAAFRGRWRVKRQQRLTLLIRVGTAQPTEQRPYIQLEEICGLIENKQVMRPALILRPVARIGNGTKLNLPPVCHAPNLLGAVVAVRIAHQRPETVNNAGELRRLAPQNHDLPVLRQRLAASKVSLAAARRTAVTDNVGLRRVGERLRTGKRHPARQELRQLRHFLALRIRHLRPQAPNPCLHRSLPRQSPARP